MMPDCNTLLRLEDLYRMPDDEFRHELVSGRLVSEPPPGARHGRIAANIVVRLGAFAQESQSGIVLTCDTGFVLHRSPDTVRAPDVAFVSRERYLALEDETRAFPGPPDLAVEVLSPGNSHASVHAKVADYLAAGTKLVWVVDPELQQLLTYRGLFSPKTLSGEDLVAADDLLPGFSVRVAGLFTI